MVHVALNSMRLLADNQRSITSSLSNQNTVGFKRDLYGNLASVYVQGDGLQDRVFPSRGEASVDVGVGKIIPSENRLDLAIEGQGFMAGQQPNGDSVYTRRGDLRVGTDRILRNGEGVAMVGDAGPITVPPYSSLEVSPDGTVLVQPLGADPATPPAALGRLRLVSIAAENLRKGLDGQLRTKDASAPLADARITLIAKGLESSNVNSVESMVEMLEASRSFELSVKMLAVAKDLDQETSKLMRSDR